MTMTYEQVAREWAEKVVAQEKIAFSIDVEKLVAARYILTTTAPLTMADVEWDDDVHAGLCAEHPKHGVVRMLGVDPAGDIQVPYIEEGQIHFLWVPPARLTPIPGTQIRLAPRREPESTPEHPEFLETEEDYRNAPEGTIVAAEGKEAWTKGEDGSWETWGIISGYNNYVMADGPRRVLRWGWEA